MIQEIEKAINMANYMYKLKYKNLFYIFINGIK